MIVLRLTACVVLALSLASACGAQQVYKGKIYNGTGSPVVVKIIGIGENHNIRHRVAANSTSQIFPLAPGQRVVLAWDEFNEISYLEKRTINGNTKFRIAETNNAPVVQYFESPASESGDDFDDDDDFESE